MKGHQQQPGGIYPLQQLRLPWLLGGLLVLGLMAGTWHATFHARPKLTPLEQAERALDAGDHNHDHKHDLQHARAQVSLVLCPA
jgi:hypothetical protein